MTDWRQKLLRTLGKQKKVWEYVLEWASCTFSYIKWGEIYLSSLVLCLDLLAYIPFLHFSLPTCRLHTDVKNLKTLLGAVPAENKRSLLSLGWVMGNGRWLLLGTQGRLQTAFALKIPPQEGSSKANSSSLLSLGTGSYPRKEIVLSCMEGELHAHALPIPSQVLLSLSWHQTESNWFRSSWDWLPIKPIYSSSLLTAPAFWHGWANLTI